MTDTPPDDRAFPRIAVLACQIDIPQTLKAEERDNHVARTTALVDEELSHAPADLVVLPELSSIDYSRNAFDHLDDIAEAADGPSFRQWRAIAERHNTTVVFGIARRIEAGYVISQLAVGPTGDLIGLYDKIHVAQYGASMEKEYFERAGRLCTFEVGGMTVAPIICYDIRIPELTRTLCLNHGADVILHCGAYARDRTFYSWHSFVVARALENQVYVLSLNRAGENFGRSLFCPPWVDAEGPEYHFGDAEELQRFTIDLARTDAARRTYPFLADRLDGYETLPID